ncbi:SDR family oxidoreductase [Amycolatopsis pigmentata]|uniref:SDR family oxidoreductase n=1 Tax=Amycolatopsis pigmentata TaxID=450801 RepID=A0ABW5G4A0_9PSEU
MSGETVLVTGGSGFVGAHSILRLLDAGYTVRTTVRSPEREKYVRGLLRAGGAEPGDALGFAFADLTSDEGWATAVRGCDYVLHVASPFPPTVPRHEDDLIVPARDGALRVLRAARDAGVRRVVLTSSFAAMSYGHTSLDRTFTERDWTDLDGPHVSAYAKSKTLAERAAWDFVEREGGSLELAVVNPVGVIGPVLGPELSTSSTLIQRLLNREMPALPRLSFALVDVRDVVDLHLRAMNDPAARGERFLAVAGETLWIADIARVLRDRLGARVPLRQAPNLLVRLASRTDPSLRGAVHDLGKVKRASSEKARRVLGWRPRSNEELIVDSAHSLMKFGLVKNAA